MVLFCQIKLMEQKTCDSNLYDSMIYEWYFILFSLYAWQGTIPILRQQMNWVGGVRKWHFLLIFSTIYVEVLLVDGSEKIKKFADVI